MISAAVEARVRAVRRRVLARHPFFGTLALFADWRVDDVVETAATDGRTIWVAPSFAVTLGDAQLAGVLIHELLHCALEHPRRRGSRDPFLWNVAADIVVNGMIAAEDKLALPEGAIRDEPLERLSTEEVYEQIRHGDHSRFTLSLVDLLDPPEDVAIAGLTPWSNAREQAMAAARRRNHAWGTHAGDELREMARLSSPDLAWDAILWRFMASGQADFQGFDRRFVGQGLYLDALEPQRLRLAVAVDTSGSINDDALNRFGSELQGVLGAYPLIEGEMYFADAEVHGPFPLTDEALHRHPIGGGGTSFVPFFRHIFDGEIQPDLCIYFTDGYGSFPSSLPVPPTLWVVSPGGAPTSFFPFGEVARLG